VLSLKLVGLTVPEISLIMCLSINGPGDLETGVSVTCVLGYLPTNFGLPSSFVSRVIHYVRDRQTDKRTDGRTKATLNAPYPTGGGIIITDNTAYSRADKPIQLREVKVEALPRGKGKWICIAPLF